MRDQQRRALAGRLFRDARAKRRHRIGRVGPLKSLKVSGFLSAVVLVSLGLGGCATAPPPDRVIVLDRVRTESAAASLEIVDSYSTALATVVAVLEEELGFPTLSARLRFVPNRESMGQILKAEGFPDYMAVRLAELLDGIALPGTILVNEESVQRLTWSARVRFLAHELTHVAQNQLGGNRRTPSNQWLREGFAEWVAWYVMESLAPGSLDIKRRSAERQVALAHHRGDLPVLAELATAADFFSQTPRHLAPFFYAKSFLAADLLVERHGVEAMVSYFSLFARSDNPIANFQIAFGISQSAFEQEFSSYVAALRPPDRPADRE